jgi:hypothetical protein
MYKMTDAIALQISDGPTGLVRVETQADGLAESSIRYLERRRRVEQPGTIQLDRQKDGPLFESGGVSVSVRAHKDHVEVVIAVRREAPDAISAA